MILTSRKTTGANCLTIVYRIFKVYFEKVFINSCTGYAHTDWFLGAAWYSGCFVASTMVQNQPQA